MTRPGAFARLVLLGAVLTAVLAGGVARSGDEARIGALSTSFGGRDLLVSARLSPALPVDVERRLASGLPTTVLWEIRLYVTRPIWWDGWKDERRYAVTATYRPVSGDYTLERRMDEKLLETRVLPSRDEAAGALVEVPGVPCFTMGRHLIGKPLVVKARCTYATGVALGVVPTTVQTDWRRSAVFEWSEEAR